MAIESPRPVNLVTGGYDEVVERPAPAKRDGSVRLRLRDPFEDAPEATADGSMARRNFDELLLGLSFEPEMSAQRVQEQLDLIAGGLQNEAEVAALHQNALSKLRLGQYREALDLAQRAKALCRSFPEKQGEVVARGLVVEAHIALGDHWKALAVASENLEDFRQRQDHFSFSEACRQRASALLALGDLEDAQTAARAASNAASRLRGQKQLQCQVCALEQLAEACRRAGNFEAMTQAAEELVGCCRELMAGMREARALRVCARGQLILRRPKRAIVAAGRAMTLFKENGDEAAADEMRALFARAQALREGMRAAAQDARQAWLLYREHGDPRLLFDAAKSCHDAHHRFDDQNVLMLEKL